MTCARFAFASHPDAIGDLRQLPDTIRDLAFLELQNLAHGSGDCLPLDGRLTVGRRPVAGERWHADFSSRTPLHLLAATARVFSSTEPVERSLGDIPERHLPFITATPADERALSRQSAALVRTSNAHPNRSTCSPPPPASHPAPPAPPRHR